MYPKSSLSIAYRNPDARPKRRIALTIAAIAASTIGLGLTAARAFAQDAGKDAAKELHVAAAADLQTVLPTLAPLYEKKTGVKLVISYGSSGNLSKQIQQGLPVDLFLGADYTFPEQIVAANLADERDPVAYAKGSLVLWTRKDTPFNPLSLDALYDPRVEKIAIADEIRAPYGRAAVAALTHMHLYDKLKPKLVVGENIAQAGQFVESGNAQLGLISLTMAMSEHFRQLGSYVLVPEVYPEIRQCAVVLAKSPRRAAAHAFLDWMLSADIQSQLPKLGLKSIQ